MVEVGGKTTSPEKQAMKRAKGKAQTGNCKRATCRAARRNAARHSPEWRLAREFRRQGRGFGFTLSRCVAALVEQARAPTI
jgi:hypothetical protein